MNSPKPLTISNVSSANYITSNVAIGPPIISTAKSYTPRRGSNGFTFTPSATIVGGSVNYMEQQFPPMPSIPVVSSVNILSPQQPLIRPLTPPIVPVRTLPVLSVVPSVVPVANPINPQINTVVQNSNIYATPVFGGTYTDLPLPMRNSIAGFSFPEMIHQNHLLSAGSDYERIPLDASFSRMSTKIICPRCGQIVMTNVHLEMGVASYCWCLTLLPLACTGLCCLCLPDCKDRIHYCSCGEVVGYNKNSIC